MKGEAQENRDEHDHDLLVRHDHASEGIGMGFKQRGKRNPSGPEKRQISV